MSTYTIGQLADRSGFSASALRYYEGIGLVAPVDRTDAGYRVYDDHTVARLAFIARAKQLGCSLDEITDLVAIWDGERCGPVQRRFHELVTTNIRNTQTQIAELTALAAQLQSAAAQLSQPTIDGPCGADCACLADPSPSAATSITLVSKPTDTPIACTLEHGAMVGRLADWQVVLDQATARIEMPDGSLRVELSDAVDLAELAQLIAAEQQCCAFFSFTLTFDTRGVALEVRAPAAASDIVSSLFGAPA